MSAVRIRGRPQRCPFGGSVASLPGSRTLCGVSTTTLRNIAIILALAAIVYFVPGGGDAAALIGGLLSTAILASILDSPARRSRNLIGISWTRKPATMARYVSSIWKP